MKTQKLICTTEAQSIKESATFHGLKVSFTKQSKNINGKNILIIIEGDTDKFIEFSRELKGINTNPHLFSTWSVNFIGRCKRIKRTLKKSETLPSIAILKMKKEGRPKYAIERSKRYYLNNILQFGTITH